MVGTTYPGTLSLTLRNHLILKLVIQYFNIILDVRPLFKNKSSIVHCRAKNLSSTKTPLQKKKENNDATLNKLSDYLRKCMITNIYVDAFDWEGNINIFSKITVKF